MIATSLELKNFRNYRELHLALDPGTNIFYGDNAQGKTNLLEALYVSSTTKSYRGNKDAEMIRFGENEAHIRVALERNGVDHRIDMHLKRFGAKGVALDQVPIRRVGELFGLFHMVLFSPEDLTMIKSGPAARRRFLDMELCQMDSIYYSDLSKYNRALRQRNKLLKDVQFYPELEDTLPVWDMQLVQTGERIIARRQDFVHHLGEIASEIHAQISGGKERLTLRYEPNCRPGSLAGALARNREHDLKSGSTSVGPQRDDLCLETNNIDLRRYGSQGQQRTAALSLKLSEIELVKGRIQETPVLMLDDVLSELDRRRQNDLLGRIGGIQTLITCTGMDELIQNRLEINRLFLVQAGTVTEQKEKK